MKILFLCNQYYPGILPNGLCVEGIANELVRQGHEVHCISQLVKNTEAEGQVNGVYLHRVPGPFIDERLRRSKDGKVSKTIKIINIFKTLIFLPVWPLVSPVFTYRMAERAKRLLKEQKINQIVACYTPLSALVTAYFLKKENENIRYTAYFLDSLSGGVAPRGMSRKFVLRKGTLWEKRLLANADDVVIMKSHEKHFRSVHHDTDMRRKLHVLDIPLYKPISAEDRVQHTGNGGIRIAYVGSLQRNLKNPSYFLRVFDMLPRMGIELHFYGSSDCDDIFDAFHFENNAVIRHGQVSHEEALQAIADADILLNIGSKVECQIPCKIFEYLSMKKPIISTFSSENEPSLPYLKKYSSSFLVDERKELSENLSHLHDFLLCFRSDLITDTDIDKMFYLNTPEAFINEVVFLSQRGS